jgi:phosphatidylglycerophosphate synthase
VPAARADEARAELLERRAPQGLRVVTAADITDDYNEALRKRVPPYLLPLDSVGLPAIERRVFSAVYKGVTDLVTLYFWPAPARVVTRWCARVGITPNQVTSASLLLVLAAQYLFWNGHYITGLLAAWLMTFLDTVDGKLARVSLRSTKFGNFFDHSIDLVHPPFWWWAWIVGLPAMGLPLADAPLVLTVIVAGYIVQRLEEGLFHVFFGIAMHVWQPFDSRFRLITARRNPNLLLQTASVLFGRPDLGIIAVAAWTVVSLLVHTVRMIQAGMLRLRGPLQSWLAS